MKYDATWKKRASALVTTLLVVTVLSIIVVAFMQSMAIERRTAGSYGNIAKAQWLAEAGINAAVQRLVETTNSGPYAAVFVPDANQIPYLFYAQRRDATNSVRLEALPLFSTAVTNTLTFTNPVAALPVSTFSVSDFVTNAIIRTGLAPEDISCNINSTSADFPLGFIGINGSSTNAVSIPVNWVYVRDERGKVIGRFAFWVDDESSKLDLRYVGSSLGAARTNGADLTDISLSGLTNLGITPAVVQNLLAAKSQTNLPPTTSIARFVLGPGGADVTNTADWHRLRPYLTVFSRHDDRALDGRQKLNLNAVVSATNDPARIAAEVAAIRGALTNSLPRFGERYYSSTPVSDADKAIYATKVAANIRDFIDADNAATVLLEDGSAYVGTDSNFVPYELVDEEIPIVGKEKGPFLSEYLRVVRVISPHLTTGSGDVTVRFAHYVELHNPSGQTLTFADLGPNPYVRLSNRTTWNETTIVAPPLRPADIVMRLPANFSIPPNGYVYLTTDGPPFADSQTDYYGPASNRIVLTRGTGPGTWSPEDAGGQNIPTGSFEDYVVNTALLSDNRYSLQSGITGGSYIDNRERIVFGNDQGLIDFSLRIYSVQNNYLGRNLRNPHVLSSFISDAETDSSNTNPIGATSPRITRGDVRSNTETVRLQNNTGSSWKAGGAVYGDVYPNGTAATNSLQETLGAANYNTTQALTGVSLWRQGWREFTTNASGNHYVQNGRLNSIGELGSVYDPSRHSIDGFRSYGSTLRLGHSDAGTNNRHAVPTAADYVNWLGGRGSDQVANIAYLRNAGLLTEVFRTDTNTAGRINPNSVVRDRTGLVLSSVVAGFAYEMNPTNLASSALAGRALNSNNLVAAVRDVATSGWLVAVGDLGRSPHFHSGTNLTGVSMAGVSDFGKEEFFRRTANLLTTQSLAFTIYVRGQSGSFVGNTFRPTASVSREVTLQLVPRYPAAVNPLQPVAPSSWEVQTLRDMTY